jgi:hypothetical protein
MSVGDAESECERPVEYSSCNPVISAIKRDLAQVSRDLSEHPKVFSVS